MAMNQSNRDEEIFCERLCLGLFITYILLLVLIFIT